MISDEVKCKVCGYVFISNTIEKEHYKQWEVVDYGCPWCGKDIPLMATHERRKKRRKRVSARDRELEELEKEYYEESKRE